MNREERVVKYINSSDDFVVNGKRYCENDFYNDVEYLAKENQELREENKRLYKTIEELSQYEYAREEEDMMNYIIEQEEVFNDYSFMEK